MVCVFVFVDWRFEDLKFQIRENLLFLPINIAYDALIQICTKKQNVLKIRVLGLFDCFETELSSILLRKKMLIFDLWNGTPKNFEDLRKRN